MKTSLEYHADRTYVSKSWLDQIDRSPAHLKHYLDYPEHRGDTPALKFGRLVHAVILEPDTVNARYVVKPDGLKKPTALQRQAKNPAQATRDQIAAWDAFMDRAQGEATELVTQEDLDRAWAMRDAVMHHSLAAKLLKVGQAEVNTFWDAPLAKCKARADWLHGTQAAITVDVKTTDDARPSAFVKSILNYRYDVQADHYQEGFDNQGFVIIAVEKHPPYGVSTIAIDGELLKRGKTLRQHNLQTYAQCLQTGVWPGYPDELLTVQMPRWAQLEEAA